MKAAWAWAVEGDIDDSPWITWEGKTAARDKKLEFEEHARDCHEPVPRLRVVPLVPHDRRAAGVVRAAVALMTRPDPHGDRLAELGRAVARLRAGRRR